MDGGFTELMSFGLNLEGKEGVQADVTGYKGTKAGKCRGLRQLHKSSLQQQGREWQEKHLFPLEPVCGPRPRVQALEEQEPEVYSDAGEGGPAVLKRMVEIKLTQETTTHTPGVFKALDSC